MKTTESLCAKLKLAEHLENFIDIMQDKIDYLRACLEDENHEHDSEVDKSTEESIRINQKAIDLADRFLVELEYPDSQF